MINSPITQAWLNAPDPSTWKDILIWGVLLLSVYALRLWDVVIAPAIKKARD